MLRALAYRNYRLFFGGQVVSLVGTWITTTATNWLVYRLTGSALLLGTVAFASQLPSFLLGPFAGIVVDRVDRHRLLVVTQTISMLQSFALAALVFSGHVTIGWLITLGIVQGIVNAFDMPGRQSFLLTMIENKEDLGNAIALNSSMVNLARLVGPSIAGVIIVAVGEGWCFAIDGVSYVAVIVALLLMRIAPAPVRPARDRHAVSEFVEGLRYAFGFQPIRAVILLLAVVSLVGVPYSILMPVFATTVFEGGPRRASAPRTRCRLAACAACWRRRGSRAACPLFAAWCAPSTSASGSCRKWPPDSARRRRRRCRRSEADAFRRAHATAARRSSSTMCRDARV